jgi:hypothetical protein
VQLLVPILLSGCSWRCWCNLVRLLLLPLQLLLLLVELLLVVVELLLLVELLLVVELLLPGPLVMLVVESCLCSCCCF